MPTAAPVSLTVIDPDAAALVALYDEAAHVDVHAFKSAGRPIFSDLRSIVFNGRRYADKVAACDCANLRLFKFGDTGYTVCAAHGLQDIGTLRREVVNGMARSTGQGRRHG